MTYDPDTMCIAFTEDRRLAHGRLAEVAVATKTHLETDEHAVVLVFDATTGRPVDFDLRGSSDEVAARYSAPAPEGPRGRGRPKLGVIGKEVTLLPRHWEWLDAQPGGASVTLRKLVEVARKESIERPSQRELRDNAYRFMLAMAGDEPGFEEATRALYGGRKDDFDALVECWPTDIRDHVRTMTHDAF